MRLLLALVVALALGAAVWTYTSGGEEDPVIGPKGVGPGGGTSPGEATLSGGDGLAGPAPGEAGPSNRSAAANVEEPGGTNPTTSEKGSVLGQLVDGLGRGIADTEVWLEDSARGLRPRFSSRAPLARATTDAGGNFAFDGVPRQQGQPLLISARVAHYAPLDHRFVTTGEESENLGALQLDDGVVLWGRVTDEQGDAIPGATVRRDARMGLPSLSIGRPPAEVVATTDGEGRFEVTAQAVGPWSFRVAHPGFRDAELSGETARAGRSDRELVWVLARGATIAGRVTGHDRGDQDDLSVELWPVPVGGGSAILDLADFEQGRSAPLDGDGRFAVGGLEPDRAYRLQLQRQAPGSFLPGGVSDAVEARGGDQDVLLTYREGARLTFQVVDAVSDQPLEWLGVRSGFGMLRPDMEAGGTVRSYYPGGRVELLGLRAGPDGEEFELSVVSPAHAALVTAVALESGKTRDLGTIRLEPVTSVEVLVRDESSGRPIEGAFVRLKEFVPPTPGRTVRVGTRAGGPTARGSGSGGRVPAFPGEITPHRAPTDADGRARLSSLPGLPAKLTVEAAGYAPLVVGPIDLPEVGDHREEVRLARGGSVAILVLDPAGAPAPGQELEHERPVAANPMTTPEPARANSEGRVTFRNLEPGAHWFRVQERDAASGGFRMVSRGPDGAPMGEGWTSIDLAPGAEQELTLHLTARGRLSGLVTEDAQPLTGATLELERREGGAPGMPGSNPSARTSSQGRYAFEDMRAGDYTLIVRHPSRALESRAKVTLDAGENDLDLDLPVTVVAGKITDADGKGIEGAKVVAKRPRAGGQTRMVMMIARGGSGPGVMSVSDGTSKPEEARSDEQGRYRLRGLPAGEDVLVEASREGFQTVTSEAFQVEVGEVKEGVDVSLPPGGRLRVGVHLADHSETLMVLASYLGDGADPGPQYRIFEGEELVFEDLTAGTWSVRVQAMGPTPEGAPALPAPQTVEVVGGNEVRLDFRPE